MLLCQERLVYCCHRKHGITWRQQRLVEPFKCQAGMNHPSQLPGDCHCEGCSSQGTIYRHHYPFSASAADFPVGAITGTSTDVLCVWWLEWQARPVISNHLWGGGSSPCPRVSLHGTSGINEHMLPSDSPESGPAQTVFCSFSH